MTKLRELRNQKGLQRKFVADKLGITGKHLNDIEIATVNLTDKMAIGLAEIYCESDDYIKSIYEEVKNEKERDFIDPRTTS